jgi:C4-type Zn-finger protein
MPDSEFKKMIDNVYDATAKYCKFVIPDSIKKTGSEIYEVDLKCPYCNAEIKWENCHIPNKFFYKFNILCKNCSMRFFVVSFMEKLAYRNRRRIQFLRSIQVEAINKLNLFKIRVKND